MKNILRSLSCRLRGPQTLLRGVMLGVFSALLAVGAFAQTTGGTTGTTIDYSSSISGVSSTFSTFLNTDGPALFILLLIALAFGVVWRLVKRAVHSM